MKKGLNLGVLTLVGFLAVACSGDDQKYAQGLADGKAQGYTTGYDAGYDDGYADGDEAGYQRAKDLFASADYNSGFADGKAEGITIGYNQGYTVGKQDGQTQGYNNGYSAGKTDGKNEGYTLGYDDGYDAGDAGAYTAGYDAGYDDGYDDGADAGYDLGYDDGFDDGYDVGYDDGWSDGSYGLSVGPSKSLKGYANVISLVHNDLIDYSKIQAPKHTKKGLVANGRLLFSETSLTAKDTLKKAAVVEQYLVVEMAKQVKGKFGLSADRSLQIAKAANHFRKYSTKRALTSEDTDAYATEIVGANFAEITKAYEQGMKGNLSGFNDVMEKAAEKNGTSPENMSAIITKLFI